MPSGRREVNNGNNVLSMGAKPDNIPTSIIDTSVVL